MRFVCGLAAAGLAFSTPALAHHSGAMFDANQIVTLDGTVKEFQWTNPHAWILLWIPGDDGKPVQWAIEMNGPTGLVREGWLPKTLTPGMKVKVVIHPLKDGGRGGSFMSATAEDGTALGKRAPQ